jgi:Fe-S cluster biogenesis protein NfuA
MSNAPDANEFQAMLQRLDDLVREVERFPDPDSQDHAREIVRTLLDLHGTALERLLGHVRDSGEGGAAALDACARDDVVAGLLLLHGLHPDDLETRVLRALEQVRPALRSHGGNVELVDVRDGVVRLRMLGSCHRCPSSALTMKQTIEEAILARAPDVTAIDVEGEGGAGDDRPAVTPVGRVLIPLPVLPAVP